MMEERGIISREKSGRRDWSLLIIPTKVWINRSLRQKVREKVFKELKEIEEFRIRKYRGEIWDKSSLKLVFHGEGCKGKG
ncbi:MAG: hypothetical protein DRO05_06455 [Thermoproteota archaeon]|nr:MAG: hypothetical protein DRO05_06455 [Candidatus Korarchaeota archaeon]